MEDDHRHRRHHRHHQERLKMASEDSKPEEVDEDEGEDDDSEEWMSTEEGSPAPSLAEAVIDAFESTRAAAAASPLIANCNQTTDLTTSSIASTSLSLSKAMLVLPSDRSSSFSPESSHCPTTMTTERNVETGDQTGVAGFDDDEEDDSSEEYVDAEEGSLVSADNATKSESVIGPLIDPAAFLLEALFRQILLINRQSLTSLINLRGVSRTWSTLVLAALNSQLSLTLFAPGGADSLKAYVRSLVAANLLGDPFYRLSDHECEELLGRRPPSKRSQMAGGSSGSGKESFRAGRRYRSVSGGVIGTGGSASIHVQDPGPSAALSSDPFACPFIYYHHHYPSASNSSNPSTSKSSSSSSSSFNRYPSHLPAVLGNLQKLIVTKGNADNLDLGELLTSESAWSASLHSLVVFRPPDGLAWCPIVAGLGSLTRLELYDLHRCSVDVAALAPLLARLQHLVLSWRHPHLLETAFLRSVLAALVPGRLKHLGLLTNLAVREDGARLDEMVFDSYFPEAEAAEIAGFERRPPPRPAPKGGLITRFEALFEAWPHGRALAAGLTGLHLGDVHLELLARLVSAMPQLEHLNFVADWKQNLVSIFETLRQLPRLSSLSLYYANYFMADARPVVAVVDNADGNPVGPNAPNAPLGNHNHNHGHHHHHNPNVQQQQQQQHHFHHHHHHHFQNNPVNQLLLLHPHPHPHHHHHHGSTGSLNSGKSASSASALLPALKSLTFRCQNLLDMGDGLPALLTAVAPACAHFHLLDNSWNEMLPATRRFAGLFRAARAGQIAAHQIAAQEAEAKATQGTLSGWSGATSTSSSSTASTPASPVAIARLTIHWAEDFRAFYPRRLWSRLPERCQEPLCLQFMASQAVHNRRSRVCKARECIACRVAAAQNGGANGGVIVRRANRAAALQAAHRPQQQQQQHFLPTHRQNGGRGGGRGGVLPPPENAPQNEQQQQQ